MQQQAGSIDQMPRGHGRGTDMSTVVAEILPNTVLGKSRSVAGVKFGDFYLFGYILVTWYQSFRLCIIIKANVVGDPGVFKM